LVTDGVIVVGTTALVFQNVTYGFAPLVSPALVGVPTAPTAAAGTNTTQIATTEFIQSAVAALVASSPAALNTLAELATALGSDPNFATTMTNALAAKAPLASPNFTGAPLAPAPVRFDVSTKLANTAFLQTRGLQYSGFVSFTGALTGMVSHVGGVVHCSGAAANSYSLPDSTVNNLPPGATVRVNNWGVNIMALAIQGSDKMQENIDGSWTVTTRSIPPDSYVDCMYIGSGLWLLSGTGVIGKTRMFGGNQSFNGWLKLPNGWILQWCTSASVPNGAAGSTSWPVLFPSTCLFAIAAPLGSNASSASGNIVCGETSPSGVNLYNWGAIATPAKIFAIGC